MFRRLGLLFAALALFSIAGGHWAVLQSVAWVEMLHDYSLRDGGLAVAIEQTFDGRHPCALCREIQAARAKERKETPAAPSTRDDTKVKARLADSVLLVPTLTVTHFSFPRVVFAPGASRTDPPPTPPPRRGTLAA